LSPAQRTELAEKVQAPSLSQPEPDDDQSDKVVLIAALKATIINCSASVTDSRRAVRAAPTNTHRVAPLAATVNGQNREK
jgi:hypothetical protein